MFFPSVLYPTWGIIILFLALMEYHCSDDRAVASRIFERGLDYFGEEIDYVLRYLSFLISINDENSKFFRSGQTSNTDAML